MFARILTEEDLDFSEPALRKFSTTQQTPVTSPRSILKQNSPKKPHFEEDFSSAVEKLHDNGCIEKALATVKEVNETLQKIDIRVPEKYVAPVLYVAPREER